LVIACKYILLEGWSKVKQRVGGGKERSGFRGCCWELKEVIQGCSKAVERKSKKGLELRAQTRGMERGWMLRVSERRS